MGHCCHFHYRDDAGHVTVTGMGRVLAATVGRAGADLLVHGSSATYRRRDCVSLGPGT